MLILYAPRDSWLHLLSLGWRLPWIVDVMAGSHGTYSVMLEREDA